MGKGPIASKVTIPKSGAQCCLGPLFGVNQPSKISPPAHCRCWDDQEGFLQPGLGANYLFKHLVIPVRGGRAHLPAAGGWLGQPDLTGVPPTLHPPVLPMARPPLRKKCLQQVQESFLLHRNTASVFSPSFLPSHAADGFMRMVGNVQKAFYRHKG